MICPDFLAGANLDNGDPETLLSSVTRFFKFLTRAEVLRPIPVGYHGSAPIKNYSLLQQVAKIANNDLRRKTTMHMIRGASERLAQYPL
jgi:hypothetical protein